jgi:hypothetical protein
MLTFCGFHVDQAFTSSSFTKNTTTVMEARRRIVCQIFIVDKFLATFVGRPPLLTSRFCSINLPLDLDDKTLLSDNETFQQQVPYIDSNGWSIDGQFNSSSILRVRTMVALVRDKILEIGLNYHGNYSVDDLM